MIVYCKCRYYGVVTILLRVIVPNIFFLIVIEIVGEFSEPKNTSVKQCSITHLKLHKKNLHIDILDI